MKQFFELDPKELNWLIEKNRESYESEKTMVKAWIEEQD